MNRLSKQKQWLGLCCACLALAAGLGASFMRSVRAAGGEVFVVNLGADTPDAVLNCHCADSTGHCTLRAAIEEANFCSGPQTIKFSYAGILITPLSELPTLTDDGTTIDGSDWWYEYSGVRHPSVRIDGGGGDFNGIAIASSNNAVYGLLVVNFKRNGIFIFGNAQNNLIGGPGPQQGNVISVNGLNGVEINGVNAGNNLVARNVIGLNPLGKAEPFGTYTKWGNKRHGISVWLGALNEVVNNYIGGNDWSGVYYANTPSGFVGWNNIGVGFADKKAGNVLYGVHIQNYAKTRIYNNKIAHNRRGIYVGGGSNPRIEYNEIHDNSIKYQSESIGGGIFVTSPGSYAQIVRNIVMNNTARYGGGVAVILGADAQISENTIKANGVISTGVFQAGGGGIYVEAANAMILNNKITANNIKGPDDTTYGFGAGILTEYFGTVTIQGNQISTNKLQVNYGGGGGVGVVGGNNIAIRGNWVEENEVFSWSVAGSGIDVNSYSGPQFILEQNRIAGNSGGNGALFVNTSDNLNIYNNLIVQNEDTGIYLLELGIGANVEAIHNTIADNDNHGIHLNNSSMTLRNSIVAFNNGYGAYFQNTAGLIQFYNDFWGNVSGAGNMSFTPFMAADPLFASRSAGHFSLRPTSPCLDIGPWFINGSYSGVWRPQGPGIDLGAYEMLFNRLPIILKP